jgi:hypothetical protein
VWIIWWLLAAAVAQLAAAVLAVLELVRLYLLHKDLLTL